MQKHIHTMENLTAGLDEFIFETKACATLDSLLNDHCDLKTAQYFTLSYQVFSKENKYYWCKYLTIIAWGWFKYPDLSVVSRSTNLPNNQLIWETLTNHISVTTEFNNFPCDHQVCSYLITLWKLREPICHFARKNVVTINNYAWAECYLWQSTFGPYIMHEQTTDFVGSYLQVTWWAYGQWKVRIKCSKWQWWIFKVLLNTHQIHFTLYIANKVLYF